MPKHLLHRETVVGCAFLRRWLLVVGRIAHTPEAVVYFLHLRIYTIKREHSLQTYREHALLSMSRKLYVQQIACQMYDVNFGYLGCPKCAYRKFVLT